MITCDTCSKTASGVDDDVSGWLHAGRGDTVVDGLPPGSSDCCPACAEIARGLLAKRRKLWREQDEQIKSERGKEFEAEVRAALAREVDA